MSIIENAQYATVAWDGLESPDKENLRKYFHLRPTQSGVTIVSTLPYAPMRGITGLASVSAISDELKRISANFKKITQDDEEAAQAILRDELGFALRSDDGNHDALEEAYQAMMINSMNQSNLADSLGLIGKRIDFVASELIFELGPNRVDIVGICDGELYFFELKRDRTTKVDQVRRYVEYYSQPTNLGILKRLLQNYPIRPVKEFTAICGVMVMRYAESSFNRKLWKGLAEEHKVKILFFEDSLRFKAVVV